MSLQWPMAQCPKPAAEEECVEQLEVALVQPAIRHQTAMATRALSLIVGFAPQGRNVHIVPRGQSALGMGHALELPRTPVPVELGTRERIAVNLLVRQAIPGGKSLRQLGSEGPRRNVAIEASATGQLGSATVSMATRAMLVSVKPVLFLIFGHAMVLGAVFQFPR